jgi:hypothetical protein
MRGTYTRTEQHKATQSKHLRNGKTINCLECNTEVYKTAGQLKAGAKFCSRKCSSTSPTRMRGLTESRKGRVVSEETKEKMEHVRINQILM